MTNLCLLILPLVSFGVLGVVGVLWLMLSVYGLFVVNEIIFFFTGYELFYDCYSRTELAYSLGAIDCLLPNDMRNVHPNMTEGYFPTGKPLPPEESETNRFDLFIQLLGIQPGDHVLDCGCGHGGLVAYMRTKGIDAEGMTLCRTQYENNTSRIGPFFHLGNYTEHQKSLEHRFDFIILPGSLEHTFGGNVRHDAAYKRKHEQLKKMFSMMKDYFKAGSPHKKVLTTSLHINDRFKKKWETYVLERTFGGLYPSTEHDTIADSLQDAGYRVMMNEDYTWHYYYAAVCDPDHFGNPLDLGVMFTFFVSLLYPPILYAYVYNKLGLWAWQFDAKHHTRRTLHAEHDLTFEEDCTKRPTTLFYTMAVAS